MVIANNKEWIKRRLEQIKKECKEGTHNYQDRINLIDNIIKYIED